MDVLKNARVRKDEEGDYWLLIKTGSLQAMFCITESIDLDDPENEQLRRTLEEWMKDQDQPNGLKR